MFFKVIVEIIHDIGTALVKFDKTITNSVTNGVLLTMVNGENNIVFTHSIIPKYIWRVN